MSVTGSESDEPHFQVEICATLLTDKPPKLPLREELPSLGFEIIYNGRGVGERTSRYESKRAVEHYTKAEQVKDLTKRRIFPKSAKKIRDKLLERRRVEMELKMPHAFSYESYEHQLYDEVETTSSSSGASSENNPAKVRHDRRKLVRGRKLFRMFRRSKSADDDVILPTSIRIRKDEQTLDDILSVAAFDDLLAESQDDIRVFPSTNKISGKDTVTTVFSGGTSAGLLSGTFVNGKRKVGDPTSPSNMEIQFVASPLVDKYLPGLSTVKEAGAIDGSIAHAFVDVIDSAVPVGANKVDAVPDVFGHLSSSLYEGIPEATRAEGTEASITFENIPGSAYGDSVDGRDSAIQQRQATALAGCGITSAVCDGTTTNEHNSERKDGWLHSALRSVLAKTGDRKDGSHMKSKPSKMIEAPQPPVVNQFDIKVGESFVQPHSEELGSTPKSLENNKLSEFLTNEGVSIEIVDEIIKASPVLLRTRRESDCRLPLHVICSRVLPNRSSLEASRLTNALVFDIDAYKTLIDRVLKPHRLACLQPDSRNDLPVHLLARNLMEWEATWYERVYAQAAREGGDPGGNTSGDISKLYKMMSRTVEMVLSPVASDPKLCQMPGSVGVVLPLHIACIFTSSVRTLRKIAEANPNAASCPCDLGKLRSFVPDKSKPLELHEGLSTDFPKWEEERTLDTNPNISWSQEGSEEPLLDDRVRRSDVLFAFNPTIEPFRFDKERIQRLEALISFQTKEVMSKRDASLPMAIQILWSWMCTFQEEKNSRPTYVKSVQRIVSDLPHRAIRMLAEVKVEGGRTVLSAASPQCAKMIRDTLCDNVWDDDANDETWEGFQPTSLGDSWRREAALYCRSVLNIKEEEMPTSFIILPYMLAKQADGTITLADGSSLELASKFAASLLHLTDPRAVLYFLDMKSIRYFDQSIYESSEEDETIRLRTYSKIRELEATLLGLYGFENAYLYLVDEVKGVPIVRGPEDVYPFVLKEPASMVRKLLPLMLLGMVSMRSDKTLSVLVNIVLDVCVTKVPSNWIRAARELRSSLDDVKANELENFLNLTKLKADLTDFLSTADRRRRLADNPKNGNTEWNVELSILKMLFEMHDKSNSFCGLRRELVAGRGVVWFRSDEPSNHQSHVTFPDLGERWDSSTMDRAPPEDGARAAEEVRETVPGSPMARRIPTLEEVRQKCDAIRSSGEPRIRVPDLDELSRKHDELTRKFGNMNLRDPSDDEGSAEFPVQSVKFGFKRPPSIDYDDSSSLRVVNVNYDSSHSSEKLVFPQPQNDSSDEEARGFPTQRPIVWASDDSETSDDALMKRTKLLLQRSLSQELVAKPTAGTDSSSTSSSCSHRHPGVDPFESRERHSLLFQALAFDPPRRVHPSPPPKAVPRPAAYGAASSVVHQDVLFQLDRSPLQQDDRELIMLKVRLAQEAKKLEDLHKRVSVAERQELLLVEREKELRGKLLASSSLSSRPDECDGAAPALVRARALLVRLCALEDRLLFNQIELQHIKLEAYSLQMEIDELNESDSRSDPAPIATCQSEDAYRGTRPRPRHLPSPLHPRPKVRFAADASCGSGGNVQSTNLNDESQCSSSAMLSEIHLLPDDLSATSSTRVAVPTRRRNHHQQQQEQLRPPSRSWEQPTRGYAR